MSMTVIPTALPDVLIVTPKVFEDGRGFFYESFNERAFREATALDVRFVQDNHSGSARGVLRGMHYQVEHAQGKLVRVAVGEVFDVAVDMRRSSPHFGRWVGVALSASNRRQLWVPPGFAHGYLVTGERAEVLYKATDYWSPSHERCLRWDDPTVDVDWPLRGELPTLSTKDRAGQSLADAPAYV